jgi:hypothetical protein
MDTKALRKLLDRVSRGALSPDEAAETLGEETVSPCGSAGVNLDPHRARRAGLPEVVFAPGKGLDQLSEAVRGLAGDGKPALATRVDAVQGKFLLAEFPGSEYHARSGLFAANFRLNLEGPQPAAGEALVVSAGAADHKVALEALGTARFFGLNAGFVPDVGVAGLHRLSPHVEALAAAGVVIAVAGMDGALPSVLAGLLPAPVVAVPTSAGYGVSFNGVAALLTMLNSCAPGISVVNIDNGFGAACVAAKILRSRDRH